MSQKLLVIDDSLTVRKMVELSFRDAGWSIDFAVTGREGTTKALATAPDVILLDFVLPDMKAIEACERLAADPRSAGLAIILMSAKMEKVRDLFAPHPMVVDFVSKPFSTGDILERAARASALRSASAVASAPGAPTSTRDREPAPTAVVPVVPVVPVVQVLPPSAIRTLTIPPPAPVSPAPAFTFKQKESAANAIYQRLRPELAAIPSWMTKLGDSPPAMYFARKLLRPEVIEGILDALAPLYREMLAAPAPQAEAHPAGNVDPPLSGQVEKAGLRDLFRMLSLGNRTGELRIAHGAQTVVSYWQSGELLLASSLDPTDYMRGGPSLDAVSAEERERAEIAQRTGAVPVYVTLHDRGLLEGVDLPAVLEQQGRRVLEEARAASAVRFVWHDLDTLPGYVETHGRHVALDIEPAHQETLAQLTLERLRKPSSWRELQVHLPGPDAVYTRANGFSSRLNQLRLSAHEQRVLALVDGRNSCTAISERSGIVPAEVARILHRLASIDLVGAPAGRISSRTNGASVRRRVMILEPDREGFHAPLRSLLASRTEPLDLVDLAGEPDLLGAIHREQPALVILNGSTTDIGDMARAIRSTPHLANVSLAAVLESQVKVMMDDLAAAGFDAVLVKPVLYSDLNKLIASSFLAANGVSRGRATENHGEDSRR